MKEEKTYGGWVELGFSFEVEACLHCMHSH